MLEYLKLRPLFVSALLSAAICVGGFYSGLIPLFALFVAVLLLPVCFFIKIRPAAIFSLALFAAVCLSVLCTKGKVKALSLHSGATLSGKFYVCEPVTDQRTYDIAVLEVKDAPPLRSGEKIMITGKLEALEEGNTVTAKLQLRAIGQEYRRSWYSDGVYLRGKVQNLSLIERDGDPVLSASRNLRSALETSLFGSMGEEEAATLSAVLLGNKSHLSEPFNDLVKAAGVSHIMVVSGMHLSIIMMAVLRLIRLFTNAPVVRFFVLTESILLLMLFCGLTKSILRAGLCCILYAVSLLLGRAHTPEITLCGTVTILLIASPFLVFNISFQLSVLSTLGILLCAIPLLQTARETGRFQKRFSKFTLTTLLITVSATCFSLPVTLFAFGSVSLVGIATNFLLAPVMTPVIVLTGVSLIVALIFPFASPVLLWPSASLTCYINSVIKAFGGLPFSHLYCNATESLFSVFVPVLLFFRSVRYARTAPAAPFASGKISSGR